LFKKLLVTVSLIAIVVTVNPTKALAVTSDKSITWTKTTKESESNNYYDVTYNKDKVYVVVGDDGAIVRSEDAKVWTSIAPRTTENLTTIATNGQQFVAAGNNGIIMQSADGKSWRKGSVSFTKEYTYEQVTGKTRSYIEDSYKINWTSKVKQSQLRFKDILWDGKRYVAIARWGVDTGRLKKEQYSYSPTYHLSSNFILTSKDGIKWKAKYVNVPEWDKIVYAGGRYTAISEYKVTTSKDLVKWNGKQFLTIGGQIYPSGNSFDGENIVAFSKDGKTWKLKDGNDCYYRYGTYGNKNYIAFDINGVMYSSTNGIDYKRTSKVTSQPLTTALWDGKKFLVGGEMGVILASAKGKDVDIPAQDKWIDDSATYSLVFE
jgi:hypothetical protein